MAEVNPTPPRRRGRRRPEPSRAGGFPLKERAGSLRRALESAPVLEERWPERRQWTLFEALAAAEPEAAARLKRLLATAELLAETPVLAVAGLLNAGKSSLTASFLSEAGRRRVLRGTDRASGSQRFTLWCPASWEASSRREVLFAALEEVCGRAPEPLAAGRERALAQQRDKIRAASLLVAFDPALDEWGVCLLDCIDVERPDAGEGAAPWAWGERLELLRRMASLISAAVLVLSRSRIETRAVDALLEALGEAKKIWAVNLVRDEPAHRVRAEALERLGVDASASRAEEALLYVAYDFDLRGYRQRTPAWDSNLADPKQLPLPCFFLATAREEENLPRAVDPSRDVRRLPERLPPEALLPGYQRRLRDEIARGAEEALRRVRERTVRDERCLRRAAAELQRAVRAAVGEAAGKGGEACLFLDQAALRALEQSLERTLPWDVRQWAVATNRIRRAGSWAQDRSRRAFRAIRRKALGAPAAETEASGQGKAAATRRLQERLAEALSLWSRNPLGEESASAERDPRWFLDEPRAERLAARVLDRLRSLSEERARVVPLEELDEAARAAWESLGLERRVLRHVAPPLLFVLSVAAAVSLPGLGPGILTLKELFAGTALAGGVGLHLAQSLDARVKKWFGPNFLAALAAQEAGLPLEMMDLPKELRDLLAAPAGVSAPSPLGGWRWRLFREAASRRIEQELLAFSG